MKKNIEINTKQLKEIDDKEHFLKKSHDDTIQLLKEQKKQPRKDHITITSKFLKEYFK